MPNEEAISCIEARIGLDLSSTSQVRPAKIRTRAILQARVAARALAKLCERTTMKIRTYFATLWAGPDPVLAEAGIAGELLVAKIRLALATLLLLIPAINSLFFFPVETKE